VIDGHVARAVEQLKQPAVAPVAADVEKQLLRISMRRACWLGKFVVVPSTLMPAARGEPRLLEKTTSSIVDQGACPSWFLT
jgi:hypothetical protein